MPPVTVFYKGQDVCVVGGGNTAVERALYLSNIASKVYLIHRRDGFKAEAIMIDKLMEKVREGKIVLKLHATLDEVLGDEKGVNAVRIKSTQDGSAEFGCSGVLHRHWARTQYRNFQGPVADGQRLSRHAGRSARLCHPDQRSRRVCRRGCADHIYRQAITSAGTGCMAALDAQRFLEQAS